MRNKSKKNQAKNATTMQLSFPFPPPQKMIKMNNVVEIEPKIRSNSVKKNEKFINEITMRFIKHSEKLDW